MAKRKRKENGESANLPKPSENKKIKPITPSSPSTSTTIQIVVGSYDRVLHGITANIPSSKQEVDFADTFLFDAHTSAIRCLAISAPSAPVPNQSQKIILASGSTDERINLYHLSAHAPSSYSLPSNPLTSKPTVENAQNRELGTLVHHGQALTALAFPTRSKLLSSAEDSTVAVTRTRDWSLLSTIKAPIPKAIGRPSGDTAPIGGAPSGVNDFAVHPSNKLMITVGKGEKCMRLWNLLTGKRAGVLNFERGMLGEVGEGRFSSGEGRKVAWGATDEGDEFAVGFERGVLVFGMDSRPRCKVVPQPRTKIHQMRYVQVAEQEDVQVMALSTEDGRILFYSTRPADLITAEAVEGKEPGLPSAKLFAQLGGKATGVEGRIKDFTMLSVGEGAKREFVTVTASSDGAVRLWKVSAIADLSPHKGETKQVGTLSGTYETGNRITCLVAFVMLPSVEVEVGVDDFEGFEDEEDSDSDSDSE